MQEEEETKNEAKKVIWSGREERGKTLMAYLSNVQWQLSSDECLLGLTLHSLL